MSGAFIREESGAPIEFPIWGYAFFFHHVLLIHDYMRREEGIGIGCTELIERCAGDGSILYLTFDFAGDCFAGQYTVSRCGYENCDDDRVRFHVVLAPHEKGA